MLADIQRLQEASHTRLGGIIKNPTITSWLRHGKPCLEEKETYNVSLKIEPRNPSETLERLLMDEQQMRKQLTELQVRNATLEEANQKLQATVAYVRLKSITVFTSDRSILLFAYFCVLSRPY